MMIVGSDKRLCACCMEAHEVKTVFIHETSTFKGEKVEYEASYLYCDEAEEIYMDEQQIRENDIRLKDAYRKNEGLLTSSEIIKIRTKYGITQSDLCILLGWGKKTITRYEGCQIQDKAHDTILRKLANDSEWFLTLLKAAKENLEPKAYQKYSNIATTLFEKDQDSYLRKSIEANYAKYKESKMYNGNVALSLDKVVDVIRYFAASEQVTSLYKVKLMKLMWYADALAYKTRGFAITGLIYQSLPMGAVPIGDNSIIDLKDVPCEEVDMGETNAYYFYLEEETNFPSLTKEDKEILDFVIRKLGKMTKNQIVSFMHKEQSYIKTIPREIISFEHIDSLQI